MSKGAQKCHRRFRHPDFGIPSDFVIRHSELRFMESPLSLLHMHEDHEPTLTPPRRGTDRTRRNAGSQGAAGILPAVPFPDCSAGKMPAALCGSWKTGSMPFELCTLAAIIVLLNLPLLHGACAVDMIFLPDRVAAGEWWRVFTHWFVHVSWYHLLLDAAAFLMLYQGLAGRSAFERMGYVLACGAGSLLASLWSAPIVQTHGLCGPPGSLTG